MYPRSGIGIWCCFGFVTRQLRFAGERFRPLMRIRVLEVNRAPNSPFPGMLLSCCNDRRKKQLGATFANEHLEYAA